MSNGDDRVYQKRYRDEHKEEIKQYNKEYREKHPFFNISATRKFNRKNPFYHTVYMRNWRFKKALQGLCQSCGKNPIAIGRSVCSCENCLDKHNERQNKKKF